MIYTDACIYFIIAILGMAYPISLQVVTRLDEKYASVNILDRFNTEWNGRLFTYSLYVTLFYCLFHFIYKATNGGPCNSGKNCYFWYDAGLLLITAVLVFSFLLYTYKIFIYYSPFRLSKYFTEQTETKDLSYFKCLADIFYLSIRIKDVNLARTIKSNFYQRFAQLRSEAATSEVIYPSAYYEMVYTALIEASENGSKKNLNIGLDVASSRYFLGEHNYTNISQQTYSWMWHNLRFITETENDGFAFEYWEHSNQFMSSAIPAVQMKTNREDTIEVTNKADVDRREKEREKFFEFHIALGGMMLYGQRYKLLDRIFRHTDSMPPRYELLPSTMTTVFGLFVRFASSVNTMIPYPYHFYGSAGIAGEQLSHNWICKYIALLLLRQYTVTSYYYGQDPIRSPYLPTSRAEKKTWLDCMKYLKNCIRDVRNQKELMETTGIAIVTDAWCIEMNIHTPEGLLDDVIERLNTALSVQEIEQPLSQNKVKAFYEKSTVMLKEHTKKYSKITIPVVEEKEYTSTSVTGGIDLFKKEAFADDQGTSYINFDTQLGSKVAAKITTRITQSLKSKIGESYIFENHNIFRAIDSLVDKNVNYVLLNFGISIPLLIQENKIEELTAYTYKKIPIIDVPLYDRRIIDYSLLLVKKSDLPSLLFNDIDQTEIEKYKLEKIDGEINLYANVIDLHEEPNFKTQYGHIADETLDKSVLLKLSLDMEIQIPKDAKFTELRLYSLLRQTGKPNTLSDL